MIKLAVLRVKPAEEKQLRDWMAELNHRRSEVLKTFANEGMRHEQAHLLHTSDGPMLIYAMEAADHDQAESAFQNSTLRIDQQHRRIMEQVLAGPAKVELLYECNACD
jgi:Family of unknown function (DUF6176)